MIWLSLAITIALLITIALPVSVGIWFNRKYQLPWRIILYGVMGYLVMQSVASLILSGVNALVANGTLVLSETALATLQLVLSILLAAILGVAVRWALMRYFPEKLNTLEPAFGIGLGYGGAESVMIVGLQLLITFITMLTNLNYQSASAGLDPDLVTQLDALWAVSPLIPLAGSLERLAALVMHLTVTILILQFFLHQKKLYLLAAVGVELVVNGFVVGLAQTGLHYGWSILASVILMGGNLYFLYRLKAFSFTAYQEEPKIPDKETEL